MMTLKLLDVLFAVLLLILGLHILWQSSLYGYMRGDVPGPGFFPLWTGLVLTGISGVNLVRAFGARALAGGIPRQELLQIGLLLGAITAFALVAPYTGMVAAAVPFVLAAGLVIEWRVHDRVFLVKLVALAIAMPAVCYIIFSRLLRVPLL